MKTILIATVGEQTKPIYEGFNKVKDIDKIYLLCSETTKRFAEEIRKNILNIYSDVELIVTSASELHAILEDLHKHVDYRRNDKIVSNITGGTKVMTLALYIYTMLLNGEAFYIFKNEDESMEFFRLPCLKFNYRDIFGSKGHRYKIAKLLLFKPRNQTEIAKELKLKDSTVSAHIEKMRQEGIVNIHYRGREKEIELTLFGKAMVWVYEIEKKKSEMDWFETNEK